ncbi:para-nitrobenzyl esterase [Pseudobutyrivibrio sp. UC1225]|uniref:carboxylesterase family protein n=1 Tax=Pseudobutyrivibrio sp. UC1225 TaxID=1798185 RepID=UPI0008E7E10D|nr:carboxylesterase family protein [Pseudobutyrivibrio sp. UC1225]SFO18502.1 para-nitrobenzyl esterase [Pseudobutyrivibrio sp. UC1225]
MKKRLSRIMALSLAIAMVSSSSLTVLAAPETTISVEKDVAATSLVKQTQYGAVKGTSTDTCNVWYSIPYAAAPTGDLRWAAPTAPTSWATPLDCSKLGNKAIQSGKDYATGKTVVSGSEDCLNLDVYAPANAENLPVMVYIHGGNNQTGSSTEIDGTQITVDENCIYVSLNYRLGILGFNALPAFHTTEGSTGNYAMLDIAMALDWVKNNIAQFGGNPNNITVSGFSAGGRDVMAMLISPLFEGKFDKAVVYSGGMTVADKDESAEIMAKAVAPLAVEDGLFADIETAKTWLLSNDPAVVTYMKGIGADRLCQLMSNAGIRMSVFPHLYADDVVIPSEGFKTTKFNNVPVLMLTGETEFSLFSAYDGYFSGADMKAFDAKTQDLAKSYSIEYGSEMYRIFNAQCSAEEMYGKYKNNMYLCQVRYGSNNSATRIPLMGSFHGIFVPMLTDNHSYGSFADFSATGYQNMANVFDQYLSNFIATGNPNGAGLDKWSNWTSSNPVSLVLDADANNAIVSLENVSSSYGKIIGQMNSDNIVSDDVKDLMGKNVLNGRWFSSTLDNYYKNK